MYQRWGKLPAAGTNTHNTSTVAHLLSRRALTLSFPPPHLLSLPLVGKSNYPSFILIPLRIASRKFSPLLPFLSSSVCA